MKSARLTVLTLATAGLIGGAALAADNQQSKSAQQQSSQNESSQSNANNQQNQKAPEGFVLFREDVVWVTANEPQNHFLRAHELLNQNKPREAAGELRVAAAYLDMEASRGQNQNDQRLNQAATDLRNQAKQLASEKQGNSNSSNNQQLTQSFAEANVALADHLQSLAKNELQSNKKVMAGHDLLGAADSLQAAYVWSNQQPQQQASSAITNARQAADQLLGAENYYEPNNNEQGAQPAGAKINGNNQSQSQANADPSSAIDQLGKAIQSCNCGQSSPSNQNSSSK